MKSIRVVYLLLLTGIFSLTLSAKPSVAILDFEAIGLTDDIVSVVSEIFRSKVIISNEFKVIERNDLAHILEEQNLQLSGIVTDGGLQAGVIQGVDLIMTGSLYKLDKTLLMTAKIINVNTAEITAVAEKNIRSLDTVDSAVKEIVAELIIPTTGKKKFTYNTETEGYSLMLGLSGVTGTSTSRFSTNPNPAGVGFTLGGIYGRGKFWSGFSTSWNFTNDKMDYGHASERKLGTASIDLIFGDMVDNFAFDIGFGGGYDFSFGVLLHPVIGVWYKNIFIKYSPILDFDVVYGGISGTYHRIEAGYCFFFGARGKEPTKFFQD